MRRNDQNVKKITIDLQNYSDDDLATALEQNNHISDLRLKFAGSRTDADWSSLRRVIATREKLRRVEVNCPLRSNAAHLRQKEAFIRSFILAIQQNTYIKGFIVNGPFSRSLVASMSSFIDNAPPALKLIGFQGDIADPENQQQLAAALQRNSNIAVVYLNVNDQCMLPILQSLSARKILLELLVIVFSSVETPRVILEVVSKIRDKRLKIAGTRVAGTVFPALPDKIPAFHCSKLDIIFLGNATEIANVKPDILAALKRNFNLRRVRCTHHLDARLPLAPVFDGADNSRLAFFFERNRLLAHWLQNPATVPQHLWPRALKLAQEAGRESLYQSLRKVAPEVGSSLYTRKRKRTQLYEPSA